MTRRVPWPLGTERCFLRPLAIRDVTENYLSWFKDPDVRSQIQYARGEVTLDKLRDYVGRRLRRKDVIFLGIFLKRNGEHIGNLKFEPIDRLRRVAVLGILIGKPAWRGRGIAQEVIPAAARHIAKPVGIDRVILGVSPENIAARRAYARIGFRATGACANVASSRGAIAMAWSVH